MFTFYTQIQIMNHLLCFFLYSFLILTSCKNDEKTPLLLGSWQGVSWTVGDKDSGRNVAEVTFEFRADGSYTAQYGGQSETGDFHLRGDELFTTAAGSNKVKKMVKLSTISADTLVMDMSRVGEAERLVLVKK